MPNRIIKESICTSEEIDSLSPFEEIFFYRLMVNCDDFGCMDARPRILISKLFPLKNISEEFVISTLDNFVAAGLIELYDVKGRPYLHMSSWEKHQQIRAQKRKYPSPEEPTATMISAESIGYQLKTDDIKYQKMWNDINGNHLISDDSKCYRNPIQSNIESKTESNTIIFAPNDDDGGFDNSKDINEQTIESRLPKMKKQQSVDTSPVVFQLMLNDKSMYDVHQSFVDECKKLYPNVNVEQSFRNMIGWINSNPTKRKTSSGIKRFINSWLSREQNRGNYNNQKIVGANGVVLSSTEDHTLDDIF